MSRRRIEFPADVTTSQVSGLIDEYCFDERNRAILKRRFLDGITLEKLSEEFDLSVNMIQRIVSKEGDKVLLKIWKNSI